METILPLAIVVAPVALAVLMMLLLGRRRDIAEAAKVHSSSRARPE